MGLYNLKKQVKKESNFELDLTNQKFNLLRSIKTDNMDLSKPFIDDEFRSGTQWVYFGDNNLYPNILNQLYLSSPMHAACVNFKTWSLIGNGYEWVNYESLGTKEKIRIKTFENFNKTKDSFRKITKDWIKHGRAIILLHYNKDKNEYDNFKVVDPAEIRNNKANLFNDVTTYYYSDNWVYRSNTKKISKYSETNCDEWQIFEIKNDVGSSRTYGLPDWISSANWQSVSADLGLLHKSALENGIQPSVLFMYPYLMADEEESNWVRNMRDNYKGVKNYNRGMKIEANGSENMPEVKVLETSDNHQLFEQTSKEQKEEIAISHNINPALMGVRIAGSLGQSEEIQFSAKQFEKVWLNDNRQKVEDFINDICSIMNINYKIKINKTEINDIVNKNQGE